MMNDELAKLKELTKTLTSNGYLTDQTVAWEYAFNSVNDLVCITNTSCQIKFLNTKFLEKLPLEHDQYINVHINDLFVDDVVDEATCCNISNEDVVYKEAFFPELGGWFVKRRYVIKNKFDDVIGYTFMFLDVTDRRRAEVKLVASEARFENFFRYMPASAVVFEPVDDGKNFRILDLNTSTMVTENVDKSVIGKYVSEVFPNAEKYGFLKHLQEAYKTGKLVHMPTTYYKDKFREGWRNNFIFKLPSGEVISLYTDETEKVKTQTELKLNQDTLQAIFDCIPDVIGLQDVDNNIIRYNKAALSLFGKKPFEVVGKKCYEALGRNKPCVDCRTRDCKISKKPEKKNLYIEELGGWYDCRAYPILDENGDVVQVVEHLRDISEIKEAQEKRDFYYNQLIKFFNRMYFIVTAVDGFIWEKSITKKSKELVYTYIDARLCKAFYGLDSEFSDNYCYVCTDAIGKTATELIKKYSANNKVHSFIDICTVADEHCISQGKACDYFELGYIENKDGVLDWLVLKVRKEPLFDAEGNITGLIGFADDCRNDMHSIRDLLSKGMVNGTIEKIADTGEAKVYYVVEHKNEDTNLVYKDFP